MSQDRYFEKFPVITYANNQVVDITERVVFLDNVMKNPYLFYPYEITSDERADQFSDRYYEDQYKSWVLYLSNQIVDPYYEWYMDQNSFEGFVAKKYGSIAISREKTKSYVCNYENGENISVQRYNSLPPTLLKYWEPDYNNSSRILSYKRKAIKSELNTNKIYSYHVTTTGWVMDEIVDIAIDSTHKGTGQVLSYNSGTLYVQHLEGFFQGTNAVPVSGTSRVTGRESGTTSILSSVTRRAENLLPEEEIYWSPLTYFDYEMLKNEYNKTIRVLDKKFAQQISTNLQEILK